MNRVATLIAVAVSVVAPAWSHAEIIPLHTFINSSQVVSQSTGLPEDTGSEAIGVGVFEFDTVTKALTWTGIALTPSLLQGTETAVGTGIFGPAAPGVNAAGALTNPPAPLIDLPVGTLKQDSFIDISTISPTAESELLAGEWYVSIATTAFPDGEIRGQIVPEPPTLSLLALCPILLVCSRRRRTLAN